MPKSLRAANSQTLDSNFSFEFTTQFVDSVRQTPTTRPPRQERQSVKPPLEKNQVEPFFDYKCLSFYFQQIEMKK